MNDSNAEHFQAHRDDEDEWEQTVRRRKKPGRLDAVVSVRFSPEEESLLRRRAESEGVTLSALIRDAALERARPELVAFSLSRVVSYATGGTIRPDGRIELTRRDPIPAGVPLVEAM